MYTVLGTGLDDNKEPKVVLREAVGELISLAGNLLNDSNIRVEKEGVTLDTQSIEAHLENMVKLTSENEFHFADFEDLYEDLTLAELTIIEDIGDYGAGMVNIEAIKERILDSIYRIKLNLIGSPERLIKEENERASREIEHQREKENSTEKAKREVKRIVIEVSNLLAELASLHHNPSSLLGLIDIRNLVATLESNGIEITKKELLRVLEEKFLEALIEIERGSKDSHIFRNHGEDLSIEEMNRLLEIKGRNPNRNRTFQSKFINNIYVARAVIQNITEINETVKKLKEKFERFNKRTKDHRGRIIEASEEELYYARFKYNVGTVYPTKSFEDGTLYVDEEGSQESDTALICLRYSLYPQEIEGEYAEGYKLAIETMYPVIVK